MSEMIDEIQRMALQTDRDDLLAVLSMRFGTVPESVQARIASLRALDTLERLILVAANTPDWKTFVEELDAGSHAFRLVGQRYNPMAGPATRTTPRPSGAPGGGAKSQ